MQSVSVSSSVVDKLQRKTLQRTISDILNFAKHTVLPSPDPDLFKDYLMAGDVGLLCINVGKSTGPEQLVVCNPLTHQVKVLPPLKYSRQPVLMHLRVVDGSENYKILVAGSAAIGTEDALSLKTEEYDSKTGKWECPENSDLPCSAFGLNEYQNGVYVSDSGRELLLCVGMFDARGRGVLVYDLKEQKWEQGPTRFHIPLVRSEANVGYLATTQIVECGGSVFVFSEQECGREMYFLIHRLDVDGSEEQAWEEIMRRKRPGGRALLVYPEFTCVAVSEHELGIFNIVEHTMEIIDVRNPTEVAPFLSAPSSKASRFYSLNPIGFAYRPSFKIAVCPRGRHLELQCKSGPTQGQYCSECEGRGSDCKFYWSFGTEERPEYGSRDSESGVHKNVGPKVRNSAVFVDAAAAPKSVSNETPRSTDVHEFGGSNPKVFKPCQKNTRRRRKSGCDQSGLDSAIAYPRLLLNGLRASSACSLRMLPSRAFARNPRKWRALLPGGRHNASPANRAASPLRSFPVLKLANPGKDSLVAGENKLPAKRRNLLRARAT